MVSNLIIRFVLPVLAIGLLVYAFMFVNAQDRTQPAAPPATPPPRSPFDATVAGAGIVEPQTENIAIGSSTPGVVTKVLVKVDQTVKTGDELFELDDRMLQAELTSRRATLKAAQAELTRMENEPRPEQLRMMAAKLQEAQANLVNAEDQLKRAKELYQRKVETAETLIERQQTVRMAEAQVAAAQAEYDMRENGAWRYDLHVAQAAVAQAEATVQHTLIEIDRLTVRALVDGRVLKVNVRPGEFVGAPPDQALIVLGNIEHMHVRVDIDENDIPRFVAGASGVASVRGEPGVKYPLTFVRVEPYVVPKKSLTGDNTERVDTRVLQVIYEIEPKDRMLYVGQQLDVYIEAPQKPAPVADITPPAADGKQAPADAAKVTPPTA
jgi:multidrug resistance efflux pump